MMGDEQGQDPQSMPPWTSGSRLLPRREAIAAGAAVLVVLLVAALVGYNLFTSDDESSDAPPASAVETPGDASSNPAGGRKPSSATDPGGPDAYQVPPWTLIATVGGDIASYPRPGAEPDGIVPATWHDRLTALPVIGEKKGWLRVRLPQRPNGLTTWIRRQDVEVTSTPYRIVIDIATMRLRLYESSKVVLDAPAGIGTDDAPTNVGKFFVTFLQEPPDEGNWGPFVMVTSSHSETISDWQESGDAIAAIHGPLGSASAIGNTGAKVSHGCIRLQLDDLLALRDVPAGSPIDVIDSATMGRNSG